jgi:transposase InsO family protein
MIVRQGEIYFDESHIKALKEEPDYVRERYGAVAKTLAPKPFGITREKAAKLIERSLRQLYRILKRFKKDGIPGLRHRSKRPKTIPIKTPREIEEKVLAVRKETGFGPRSVSDIVNESLQREDRPEYVYPSLTYNILVREGEIERERRIQKKWKRFEWGHPNRLIQADLTDFNGVAILTMEDDHSRRGWAISLQNKEDKTVVEGMKELVKVRYDNLLTDNGSQFSRANAEIRRYCEEYINEKHIWTSIHHPQTLGKLSAYQKGLKRFLRHRLGSSRNKTEINKWIRTYNTWYNNGKYHSSIGTYPEERYSGQRDEKWYVRLVKALKLEDFLTSTA